MNEQKINDEVIQKIQKDTYALERKANGFQLKNDADVESAVEFLGQVKTRSKRLEEMRVEYTKPLNDHIKKINADFKGWLAPYIEMETRIKGMIGTYRAEQEAKRQELERKLREEAEEKARAEARKKHTSQKEAVENVIVPIVEQQTNIVESKTSKAKFRKVKKYRIIDENKIPRKYLMPNDRAIKNEMANGIEAIAGIEFYEEEIIAGYSA